MTTIWSKHVKCTYKFIGGLHVASTMDTEMNTQGVRLMLLFMEQFLLVLVQLCQVS